jgi:MIP family channel proteins
MCSFKACAAEVVGTFFLCFAGIAAILSTQAPINSGIGLVGIALAHGLALSVAVSNFGGISGAHFNPAVTAGMLVTCRIRFLTAVCYVIAQLLGASLAAGACLAIFPVSASDAAKLGTPLPPDAEWVTTTMVLSVEAVLTFLLVTSVFGAAVDERGKAVKIGGFAIGLTVAFDILAGGPLTGASMNPARSFGPAFVRWASAVANQDAAAARAAWDWHGYYWGGPMIGAVVAALFYHHVLMDKSEAKCG